MADPFDPYYRWLGIPPEDQPPSHYRLLGIRPFEADAGVIEAAADRQMVHLRSYQAGRHAALCEKLLNEVAAARVTLLNPAKKAAYDDRLRTGAKVEGRARSATGALRDLPPASPAWAGGPPKAPAVVVEAGSRLPSHRPRSFSWGVPAAVILGLLAAGGLLLVVLWRSGPGRDAGDTGRSGAAAVSLPTPGKGTPAVEAGPKLAGRGDGTRGHDISGAHGPAPLGQGPQAPQEAASEDASTLPGTESPGAVDDLPPAADQMELPGDSLPEEANGQSAAVDTTAAESSTQPEQTARTPVPDRAEQQKALALVREVFQEDYKQADTAPGKVALARKTLQQAKQPETNATSRYVLLRLAGEMAAEGGDVETAFEAIDEMAAGYEVDAGPMKLTAFFQSAKSATVTEHRAAVAKRAAGLIRDAVAADDYVTAARLGAAGLDAARGSRDGEATRQIAALNREVERMERVYAEVQPALARLADSPADPEANLAVGKYLCLLKGDWERGVPMLARGSDPELSALASRESHAAMGPQEQTSLGDGWLALSEKAEDAIKEQLLFRAYYWYSQAASGSIGLARAALEKKLWAIRDSGLLNLPVPKDAVPFKGHYYKFFDTPMTWHCALGACERLGGHLARIESPQEETFVESLLLAEFAWVDGSDQFQEGAWLFSDGTRMAFTNWKPGEPNNFGGHQHALSLVRGRRWIDASAAVRIPFMCEWDGKTTRVPGSPQTSLKIPRGAARFDDHRYQRFDVRVTWHVARRMCEEMGGHLARVESQREDQFIQQLVHEKRESVYWLDGSDEVTEGDWRFSNGAPITYTNWQTGEPNSGTGRKGGRLVRGHEHSQCIWRDKWNDAPDGRREGFVCEWDE